MIRQLDDYLEALIAEVGDTDAWITAEQFLHAAIDAAELLKSEFCALCEVNTREIHEYYMVHADIWQKHGAGYGMLCVGCLEDRMGRRLSAEDFTDAPVNTDPEDNHWKRSPRLRDRLNNTITESVAA